jgi:hypothetical protein
MTGVSNVSFVSTDPTRFPSNTTSYAPRRTWIPIALCVSFSVADIVDRLSFGNAFYGPSAARPLAPLDTAHVWYRVREVVAATLVTGRPCSLAWRLASGVWRLASGVTTVRVRQNFRRVSGTPR